MLQTIADGDGDGDGADVMWCATAGEKVCKGDKEKEKPQLRCSSRSIGKLSIIQGFEMKITSNKFAEALVVSSRQKIQNPRSSTL
ncbi:hypothetical protein L1887_39106 [Cichorium endivia]|nr:hypothetical protein L1887_39106 [Cichorium endivia]